MPLLDLELVSSISMIDCHACLARVSMLLQASYNDWDPYQIFLPKWLFGLLGEGVDPSWVTWKTYSFGKNQFLYPQMNHRSKTKAGIIHACLQVRQRQLPISNPQNPLTLSPHYDCSPSFNSFRIRNHMAYRRASWTGCLVFFERATPSDSYLRLRDIIPAVRSAMTRMNSGRTSRTTCSTTVPPVLTLNEGVLR